MNSLVVKLTKAEISAVLGALIMYEFLPFYNEKKREFSALERTEIEQLEDTLLCIQDGSPTESVICDVPLTEVQHGLILECLTSILKEITSDDDADLQCHRGYRLDRAITREDVRVLRGRIAAAGSPAEGAS